MKKQSLNLKNYILHLDNWIPQNVLDDCLKKLKKNKTWERHTYTNIQNYEGHSKNGEKELDICYGDNLSYRENIMQLIWKGLEKYIVIDKIGGSQFDGWKGFQTVRFNRYNKNQIMSKHCDHIHTLFTGEKRGIPILSILGVLNDNYKGGEFIMFDDYEIKFKPGDVIIFPSVFLYPHLVKPVTKGTRYSFVSWCY